jgi:hemolysin activation/secretion protein
MFYQVPIRNWTLSFQRVGLHVHSTSESFDQFKMTNSKLAKVKTKRMLQVPQKKVNSRFHTCTLHLRSSHKKVNSQFLSPSRYTWKFLPLQYDKFKTNKSQIKGTYYITSSSNKKWSLNFAPSYTRGKFYPNSS